MEKERRGGVSAPVLETSFTVTAAATHKVEGVLPKVNAEEGSKTEERVLVGGGSRLDALRGGVVGEPGPSGSLDTESGGVDALLEVVKGAEIGLDGVGERSGLGELGLGDLRVGEVKVSHLSSGNSNFNTNVRG